MKFHKSFWFGLISVLTLTLGGVTQVFAATKFADVASYQPDDVVFFKSLATDQVAGVVVKLTQGSSDGDNYINPKAANQIKSAQTAGLKVSLYHYAKYNGTQDAKDEADFYANAAKKYGLGTDTVMVDDVEDSSLKSPKADTVTFQTELARLGYHNQVTYSMASWFWASKLPLNYPIWVANYGTSMPQVDNAAAWQYTSNYEGKSIDMSYDFTGIFTEKGTSANPSTPPVQQAPSSKTVTVKYVPGYGIALWLGLGEEREFSGRRLQDGTSWKTFGEAVIDHAYWYNLGGNQWMQASYTSQPNGQFGLTQPSAVTTTASTQLYNGLSKPVAARQLASGTSWAVHGAAQWNGGTWYNLGGNQWINGSTVK